MTRSAVLVHLRLVLVLLSAGAFMLTLGCSPATELGGEQTEWRHCEQELTSLSRAVRIWQKAHRGHLPARLEDLDMQGVRHSCPYSGFVYGYRPDLTRRTFRIICRGWAHRSDLGDVNLQVDSQTPECISFTSAPAPCDLQEKALRTRIAEQSRNSWGRQNLFAWVVGFGLVMLGLRHVTGTG